MDSKRPPKASPPKLLAPCLIVLAGLLAYSNTFAAPFQYDDEFLRNSRLIKTIWPPWAPMLGSNRPVGTFSFALNHAFSDTDVWGYHAVNLGVHIAASLVLYGIVRRTLSEGRLAPRYGGSAVGIGLAVAMLWSLHPLQTQSVTYIYQRFESQMGLFFLLTLYCFVRAQASNSDAQPTGGTAPGPATVTGTDRGKPASRALLPKRRRDSRAWLWYAASIVCCLLAIGTKEVAVVAPLLVVWYDRAFVAGAWREIWCLRKWYYLALASPYLLAGFLVITSWSAFERSGVLFVSGVSPWQYARSQPGVILHYLRLCFWPTGQCLDYGWPVAETASEILVPGAIVAALLVLTLWAVFQRPQVGFLGGWFFLILAPTSSVLPIRDLAYEHRMYLSLAAVIAGLVIAVWELARRIPGGGRPLPAPPQWLAGGLLLAAALSLGLATYRRNEVWGTCAGLWADAVRKAPDNARAHYNLANALEEAADPAGATRHYRTAIELNPADAASHDNLASLLSGTHPDQALRHYRRAVEIRPARADYRNNLARLLAMVGRTDEAVREARRAVELDPRLAGARLNLGNILAPSDAEAAAAQYREALKIDPTFAAAHNALGNLVAPKRPLEAVRHYQRALALEPEYAEAHFNLANTLVAVGDYRAAISHLREAVRLRPDWPEAAANLEVLLRASAGRG